ncbi:MAG: hypothetical protein JWQ98_1798 [Chlorobi bacterium]|nr:hypothetical protein [Chlorobiota bacterium]
MLVPLAVLLMAAGNPTTQAGPAKARYKRYRNAGCAYSIDYPDGLLYPKGEAPNGDCQVFASKDGRATLTVWGENNPLGTSLARSFATETGRPGRRITCKTLKRNWFVISGTEGDDIFYSKSVAVAGGFRTLVLRYPAGQGATYNPIAAHIAGSLDVTGVKTTME